MKFAAKDRGFTMIELVVVLLIVLIVTTLGATAFINSKKKKQIDTITDSIVAQLEKAKANAITGKNGLNYGIKFNSTSTVVFSGSAYSGADPKNITLAIPSDFTLSNDLSKPDKSIIFKRLDGTPDITGTITITDNSNTSNTERIIIGDQGEITVIK